LLAICFAGCCLASFLLLIFILKDLMFCWYPFQSLLAGLWLFGWKQSCYYCCWCSNWLVLNSYSCWRSDSTDVRLERAFACCCFAGSCGTWIGSCWRPVYSPFQDVKAHSSCFLAVWFRARTRVCWIVSVMCARLI
jgi:hypothetical protein